MITYLLGVSFSDFRYSRNSRSDVVTLERELHSGFQEAHLVAGIVPLALEDVIRKLFLS